MIKTRVADFLRTALLFFGTVIVLSLIACRETESGAGFPQVTDDNLSLELIDEAPNIMTPIGLTIDGEDKLYVLESHTHTPPKDYPGPAYDRIKKGIDEDGDGIPESWMIFAEGISDGMNLACGPDNTIYLACKDLVLAFHDTDRDGQSEQVDTLLKMSASGDIYDHAGLLGITLSPDGWLFVSRGNTGGLAWTMTAADGSSINGYGDGGNVVRLTSDGRQLEEVATGFWNPFDLKYTAEGRLLLTDNDPDSRGPNRLVEIVYGGDYGYKSLYGGSGIHPFLAWNGELPGTLPYAVALGEAPCGMIDAGFTNFGAGYEDQLLSTVWEENSIVRIPVKPTGSSISGATTVLVKGDSTFHPVALAANSKGELYLTDWVVRQYPNHRQGRIWRLTSGGESPAVQQAVVAKGAFEGGQWFNRGLTAKDYDHLQAALKEGDVFTRAVARKLLSAPVFEQQMIAQLQQPDPSLRLEALLTLFHNELQPGVTILADLLNDKDALVRGTALRYIALRSRRELYDQVVQGLSDETVSPALFDTYLATIRHLQPDFIERYQQKTKRSAKQLERKLPPGFLVSLLQDRQLPPGVRAAIIPQLDLEEVDYSLLLDLLKSSEEPVQMALVQLFTQRPQAAAGKLLLQIATNRNAGIELRTQALLSLNYQAGNYCEPVAQLLVTSKPEMEQVALRYLCRCREDEAIQTAIEEWLQSDEAIASRLPGDSRQWCGSLSIDASRPENLEEWTELIDGAGDVQQGKWVFYARKAQCRNCHKIAGWGGDFGPDLSHVGSSKSKAQLLTAILEPSAEISPEWQGWYVTDQEGKTHYGRQIDVGYDNAELLLASGDFVTYQEPQSYGMASASLMPDGLEGHLTVPELNDLITFLISLK